MRVFLDARRTFGGTERYARGVLSRLAETLPQDSLCAFGPARTALEGPVRRERGALRTAAGTLRRLALERWGLRRAAARAGASVYHALGPHVPRGLAMPSIATCFDVCALDHPATRPPGALERYERDAMLAGLARASHVVAISESVASRLRERGLVAAERVSTVYPSVPAFPPPRPLAVPHVRGRFFLFVGTLEPRKDLATLLSAHALVYDECRVPLVLVGSYGWSESGLVERLRRSPERVHWAGAVDDAQLAWLYARASALVQVSIDEGFSYPVAEALSFGTPVVASDIPVHREVAGDAASYAAVGDPEDVATRMRECLEAGSAERESAGLRARARLAALHERGDVGALVALQERLSAAAPRA